MGSKILSNQVKCNTCGEEIYSASVHDHQTCRCGSTSVDGGMDYLKRSGSNYTEMSVVIDDNAFSAMLGALNWSLETFRNPLGMTCAIGRYLRDAGYEIVKKSEKEPSDYD